MATKLQPVSLPQFQAYLFAKRDEGIRFAPAQEDILENEHIWSYVHPVTKEVCALVEVPRTADGVDLDEEKVFYVLI
jgi:hypothetical protein